MVYSHTFVCNFGGALKLSNDIYLEEADARDLLLFYFSTLFPQLMGPSVFNQSET